MKNFKKALAAVFSFALLLNTAYVPMLSVKDITISAAETEEEEDVIYADYIDGVRYAILHDPGKATIIGSDDDIVSVDLPSIVKEEKLRTIGYVSFQRHWDLESITIPDTVLKIEGYAFDQDYKLGNVDLPDSITAIDEAAFSNCYSMTEFRFPKDIKNVSVSVLANCKNMTKVTLPEKVENIFSYAFQRCSSLESIDFPDTLERIYDLAFTACSSLTEITIPDSVFYLGAYAFSECNNLKTIKLSNQIPEIGARTFYNCSALESIEIPESVTIIGENAFFGCTSLKSITIPASVTQIDTNAFGYRIGDGMKLFDLVEGFEISGYKGTAAQAYAKAHGIKFNCLDAGNIVKGDTNCDGAVTAADITATMNALISVIELDDDAFMSADIDDNGSVNILDLIMLKNMILGVE